MAEKLARPRNCPLATKKTEYGLVSTYDSMSEGALCLEQKRM